MFATLLLHIREAACWHLGPKIGYPDCFLVLLNFFSGRFRDVLSKYVVDPLHSTSIPFITGRYIINWYIPSVVQHLHAASSISLLRQRVLMYLAERTTFHKCFTFRRAVSILSSENCDNYNWVKLLWDTCSVYVDSTVLRHRSGHP